MSVFTSLAMVACMGTAVQAHMSLWHPSMFRFNENYQPVVPLAGQSFNDWVSLTSHRSPLNPHHDLDLNTTDM